jgi:glycosyltransferase involved in cell wall biosynthesis
VVLARNDVDHDSKVLREARTLVGLGFETTVLGVVSFTQTQEVTEREGFTVRRIGPSSRGAWAVYREISRLRPRRARGGEAGAAGHRSRPGPARAILRRGLRWLTTLAYYVRAIGALRLLRPDLVHCNNYYTMWVGVAARLLHGSAVVYDSHEIWADRNLRVEPRWWLMACEALFVRVADRVVATSPGHAEVLATRYRIPTPALVRNIPELTADSGPTPSPPSSQAASQKAMYVGGLQPGRGIEQSIRALALVPDVALELLGPGAPEYRAELEALVGSLGLEQRVEFREPVRPEELIDAVRGAGVGLALIEPTSLSYRLALPNKLFEYALAGIPILGSDLPMIARFVAEHRLGVTVDPGDVSAIAGALVEILEPERNSEYRRAAERSSELIDWNHDRGILADVYRGALAERLGRSARL